MIEAVIGGVFRLFGIGIAQHRAGKGTHERWRSAQLAAKHSTLDPLLDEFWKLYYDIEQTSDGKINRSGHTIRKLQVVRHGLIRHSSRQLHEPLYDLVGRLKHLYWNGPPDGRSAEDYLRSRKRAFDLTSDTVG